MLTSAEVITSSDISDLLQLYGNDISAPASLDSELRAWRLKWQRQRSDHTVKSLDSPVKVLSIVDQDFFSQYQGALLSSMHIAHHQCGM